jgi:two-component system sporulation sensor kinase A
VVNKAIVENDKETLKDFTDVVPRQLDRINEIVEKLLTLAKPQKLEKNRVSINKILEDLAKLTEKQAMKQSISIIRTFNEIPQTMADEGQLTQAFLNLILNAIQSMPDGGTLEIRTEFIGADTIKIEFIDSGVGMTKEETKKIFDPFYTTKEKGSGLGLAVTRKIIVENNGKIEVLTELGKGTTFKICFPLSTV